VWPSERYGHCVLHQKVALGEMKHWGVQEDGTCADMLGCFTIDG
jgi:hypothetical protein